MVKRQPWRPVTRKQAHKQRRVKRYVQKPPKIFHRTLQSMFPALRNTPWAKRYNFLMRNQKVPERVRKVSAVRVLSEAIFNLRRGNLIDASGNYTEEGIKSVRRMLDRMWNLTEDVLELDSSAPMEAKDPFAHQHIHFPGIRPMPANADIDYRRRERSQRKALNEHFTALAQTPEMYQLSYLAKNPDLPPREKHIMATRIFSGIVFTFRKRENVELALFFMREEMKKAMIEHERCVERGITTPLTRKDLFTEF